MIFGIVAQPKKLRTDVVKKTSTRLWLKVQVFRDDVVLKGPPLIM